MFKGLDKQKRFKILFPLIISLFGVVVTSISTAAWFQITEAGKNFTDDVTVQAGSADIAINNINAYKSAYNEISSSETDYSSSHVVRYNVKGSMGGGNINQGPITDFDVPSEGIGYYLVGDDTWATATMGMDAEAMWKYASSKRFSDPALDANNKGILKKVYLKEKTEIKVRHHYFNNGNIADDWINAALDSNDKTTTALTTSNGNIKVKDEQSGWYNIYLLNDNNKISVDPTDGPVVPAPSPKIRPANNALHPNKVITTSGGAQPVTSVYVEDQVEAGAVLISIENIGFSSGYTHAMFQTFLTEEYGAQQTYTYSEGDSMPTSAGWSYLDTQTKYLVCPTGSKNFTFYFPEWVEYCGYKIVANSYYNWFGTDSSDPGDGNNDQLFYFRKTDNGNDKAWGHCEEIKHYIYNDGKWKMNGDKYGSTTHSWTNGDITVTKTAVYHVYGNATNQTASGITSETVARYTLYDSPTTPTLSGYSWNEGDWYTDSDLSSALTTTFLIEDLEIFTEFKQEASFALYAYKRKHDGSETVMTDYNGILETGYTEGHYNPVAAPSATGYDSWSGQWYKTRATSPISYSNAYQSSDIGNPSSTTNLYTYLEESSGEMTVAKKYLSTDQSSVSDDGGSIDEIVYYCDTAFTIASLDDMVASDSKKLSVSDDSRYEFLGYSTDTTVANIIEDETRVFTSATTNLYALFAPIGPHTLYKYKSYYVYDGSSYTDFHSLDTTNLSAYQTAETSHASTLYDTVSLAVPSNSSNAYAYVDSSIYTNVNELVSGIYKFVSAGWYVGTDSGCDYSTPYVAAEPRADVYLYERMVCTLSNHEDIYVDTLGPQWTDAKAYIVAPRTGTISLCQNTFSGSSSVLSEFRIPTNDTSVTFLIFRGSDGSPQGGNTQTGDIAMDAAQWASKGTKNTLEVYNTTGNSNNRNYGWAGFYGRPSPDDDGYYLVGNDSFTGYNSGSWTLLTSKLMDDSTNNIPEDIADPVVACKTGLTLSYGMSFKIVHYETENGKVGEWIGNNLNSDNETSNIAANFGTDVEVKSGVSGTNFAIYLTSTHKIIIKDNETSTYLLFSDEPASHDTKAFKMGYGDHTNAASPANLAIYEQGIKITQEDISNDLSFVVRDRRGGALNWRTYLTTEGHGFEGDASLVEQGLTSTSNVYGDDDIFATDPYANDGLYGFKFTTPGYYKFYLTTENKVSIAPLPGDYGEGYYIVPHDDGVSGTNYYTGGAKMKEITNGTNLAVYTCYYVNSDNLSIFFRCYRSGVDVHHTSGSNEVYCSALASDATTQSLASMTDGVLTFNSEGAYNIYLFNNNGTITCSITEFTKASFFTLNSINHDLDSQSRVKEAKTGLVLEIDFTTTNANYNVQAIAEMVAEGSGASQYLTFNYSVITNTTEDDYVDYDNCYEYMYAKRYIGSDPYSPATLASGSHKMLILIDYDADDLSTLPNTPAANDFYFLIKMRQVVS